MLFVACTCCVVARRGQQRLSDGHCAAKLNPGKLPKPLVLLLLVVVICKLVV
jgi:hypothetical protein